VGLDEVESFGKYLGGSASKRRGGGGQVRAA